MWCAQEIECLFVHNICTLHTFLLVFCTLKLAQYFKVNCTL